MSKGFLQAGGGVCYYLAKIVLQALIFNYCNKNLVLLCAYWNSHIHRQAPYSAFGHTVRVTPEDSQLQLHCSRPDSAMVNVTVADGSTHDSGEEVNNFLTLVDWSYWKIYLRIEIIVVYFHPDKQR